MADKKTDAPEPRVSGVTRLKKWPNDVSPQKAGKTEKSG